MNTRLIGHRKSLVAISMLLSAYYLVGMKFEHISLLGNSFEFENPSGVVWFLWLAWLYWAIAYLQHLRVDGNREIQDRIHIEMEQILPKVAGRMFLREDEDCEESRRLFLPPKFSLIDVTIKNQEPAYWKVSAIIIVEKRLAKKSGGMDSSFTDFVISGWPLRISRWRSQVRVFLLTPYFTERLLPIILASIPVILAVQT